MEPGSGDSQDIVLDARRRIPARALEERFVASGGPGGQNVNKVASKVELRLRLDATNLAPEDLDRIHAALHTRINQEGVLILTAHEERSQSQNRELARARLAQLLRKALARPRTRRATRPSRAARQRRLDAKRERARIKSRRRWRAREDD